MTNKEFATHFNSFINETFKPGTPITTSLIKEALRKVSKNHPIHKAYKNYLSVHGNQRGWHWMLYDFDRVQRWMAYHPDYQRVKVGTYKVSKTKTVPRYQHRIQL